MILVFPMSPEATTKVILKRNSQNVQSNHSISEVITMPTQVTTLKGNAGEW